MTEEVRRFNELLDEMKVLHEAKNNMYGSSYERLIEEEGLILANKIHRAKRLIDLLSDTHLSDKMRHDLEDSLEDSLLDLGNYAFKFVSHFRKVRS